jgi:hypothetical protein
MGRGSRGKVTAEEIGRLAAIAGVKALGINLAAVGAAPTAQPLAAAERAAAVLPRYTPPGPGDYGRMNKLEKRYAAHLEWRREAGEIVRWDFEPEKFRLAEIGDACYLTPDFRLLMADGTVEFHDTKGWRTEEDAKIKIKWFRQRHPYPLVIVMEDRKNGGWTYERHDP